MLLRENRGFTLIELLVVMAIFLVIMMITSNAFKTIAGSSTQQSKSVETQIQGIIGLEVMRGDLEHAGFGLPWAFQTTSPAVTYGEVVGNSSLPAAFWPSTVTAATFNDNPANLNADLRYPRAIVSGTTTFNKDSADIGSTYLVLKSTIATNDASNKWTTVAFANGIKSVKHWGAADRDFAAGDQVIVVKNILTTTPATRMLMASASTTFSAPFSTYSTQHQPHLDGDTFEVYGIAPASPVRMPYNRADYYVMRPAPASMPVTCMNSPGVGILYKSEVMHDTGALSPGAPLLDCVADMQVVYGRDSSGAGIINDYTTDATTMPSAAALRAELKEIRVYILAHEGGIDLSYNYPSNSIYVGETLLGLPRGREFNLNDRLGSDYKHFRWKVYTIVVRPKNLLQ